MSNAAIGTGDMTREGPAVSSRTRLPDSESDSDFAWEEPFGTSTRRRGGGGDGPSMRRPQRKVALPVVGVALCAGLFIGYLVGGSGGTSVVTETATVTTSAQPAAPQTAAAGTRASISVGVLNGADETGLAGRTGERLRGLGYEEVSEGNAPSTVSSTRVMFRAGAQPQAMRVAEDLGVAAPLALTEGSEVAKAAPDSQVIVVLGRDAAGGSGAGEGTEGGQGAQLNGDEADAAPVDPAAAPQGAAEADSAAAPSGDGATADPAETPAAGIDPSEAEAGTAGPTTTAVAQEAPASTMP